MRMLPSVRISLADLGDAVTDRGDLLEVNALLIKGKRPYFVWRVGAPRNTTAADRVRPPAPLPLYMRYPGVDVAMDLKADQQVPLSLAWQDEIGNPASPPAGATVDFSVDDSNIINLTDNGDGTANAAATGVIGAATVHCEVNANGRTVTGDLLLTVVPGDAERVEVVAGEPTEVTPDV